MIFVTVARTIVTSPDYFDYDGPEYFEHCPDVQGWFVGPDEYGLCRDFHDPGDCEACCVSKFGGLINSVIQTSGPVSPVIKMGCPGSGSLNRSAVLLARSGWMARVSPVMHTARPRPDPKTRSAVLCIRAGWLGWTLR